MAFNISTLALQDTTILHLVDPSGNSLYADEAETLPVTIEVFGRSSKQYRKWQQEAARKNLARKGKAPSQEIQMEETADFLVAVTKGVSNMDMDGVALDTPEALKKLYMTPALFWISEQVASTLGELEGFLQK